MVSSLYMPTGVLYWLLTMLLICPSLPLTAANGLAALLCPLPIGFSSCGVAASDVLVTGVTLPGSEGDGDGSEPVGVTVGLQVAPPRETVSSNELPAATITSCASLWRMLNTSVPLTLISASPAIRPA
uniref:Putative secreted protein n=1 Tax=Anopheles darlingi TaxID=43151 RepID=A0A2M4DBQ8_ANODA